MSPQKLDSVVRSLTAALLACSLVGVVLYLALTVTEGLNGVQATLVGWAGVVVGFYFGGHVAQNTAALEEARQQTATAASEASALRSEAAAPPRPEG